MSRLAEFKAERGLTSKQLSQLIAVGHSTVKRWLSTGDVPAWALGYVETLDKLSNLEFKRTYKERVK